MKKLIFTLSILFTTVLAYAQPGCYWHEDFDPASLDDSVVSYVNNASNPGWDLNQRLFVSSPNSDSAYLGNSDTVILRTLGPMNFTNMNFVLLDFDQINKVHFFDQSILEFSYDSLNWTQMTDDLINGSNVDYLGSGAFSGQASSFSTASYGAWFPIAPDSVPNNTWWQHEPFDISMSAAGISSFWIRFKMFDSAGDLQDTTNGWHIDNICVTAAPCELTAPEVTQLAPIWNNIVYQLGPFTVNDSCDDQSQIAFSYLIYTINGGTPDTVVMTVGASFYLYSGDIPAVNAGDTVCYYITVVDNSGCFNTASTTQHCFVASLGLSFPYCPETFDAAVLWSDTTVAPFGSSWQLGTPAFGATTGAHSPPNAWDIDLTSGYLVNSECYLYSPVFSPPSTINARLTFWQNRQTDTQSDGVTLQYSNDGGITWPRLDVAASGGGSAVNWYSNINFNNNDSMWEGNSSGWIKSDYIFGPTELVGSGNFQVRFRFLADGFGTLAGFSLDDLCFTLPEPNDPGLSNIVSPTGNAPAGTCVPVTVMVHNYGSNQLDSANVYYTYMGIQHGPFLWTGPLASGAEAQFTMPCDTIVQGYNDLCAWVSLGADVNHSNDTACATLFGIPTIVIDSLHPYCDDFEGANLWFSQLNPGGDPSTNWELGTPSFGTTNSTHSGVNAWDLNLAVSYQNNADVSLYTPFFEITNCFNPYLDFWINFNTETAWDGVRMEYYESVNQTWTMVPLNLPGAINWYNQTNIICSNLPAWAGTGTAGTGGLWWNVHADDLNLLNLINSTYVQFRFTFCSDGSVIYDGESIDDFCFAMPAPYDAGVTTILQPAFSAPADSCEPVEVTIKNFGYNTLTSLNVYYSKDDIPYGNPVTYGPYLWTGNLAAGASTTWILPVCDTVPAGAYDFCSWTQIINPLVDGNFYNDTSCTQGIGIPTIELSYTNIYCDNFDSVNVGWSVEVVTPTSPVTRWELGPPAFGTTNSALSSPNAWDVNLTTPYQGLAHTRLYTPYFNFSQAVDTKLNFWVNFNTSLSSDGVHFDFRIGNGAWVTLFNSGIGFTNWYNSVACNQAAWSGNSSVVLQNPNANGWAQVLVNSLSTFNNLLDPVQFRFDFCSGNQFPFPSDGFSIDDFCLEVPVPLTATPTSCHNTSSPPFIFPGQPISFDANIKNAGTTALNSVVAQVYVGTQQVASDTIIFSPALPYGQSVNHVFSQTWVTAPGVHNVCMITTYPNQGTDLNPTDDTLCCTISVIDTVSVASTPYCPDFDTAPQWVTLNAFPPYAPNSSWNFGAPNVGFMNSARTGTNAWKIGPLTGVNGNYPNNDSSALFTPAFNIQVGRTYNLSFWHEYVFEPYQDGGNVEYSTDFGGSWNVLGTGGSTTWYDSYFVTALGGTPPQPGWSIANQVWSNPHHEICFQPQNGQLAYPVMFRFRFGSDYSVNNLGWLIDDFCFEDIGSCPVGIEEMTSASGLILGQNRPNPTNGMTSIDYIIPENGKVVLNIVNLLGQTMDTPVNEEQVSGRHMVDFNTNRLSPGIYYYSLTFNKETLVKKMVITK